MGDLLNKALYRFTPTTGSLRHHTYLYSQSSPLRVNLKLLILYSFFQGLSTIFLKFFRYFVFIHLEDTFYDFCTLLAHKTWIINFYALIQCTFMCLFYFQETSTCLNSTIKKACCKIYNRLNSYMIVYRFFR